MLSSINPATGEKLETYEEMSPEEVKRALEGAERAFWKWKSTNFEGRAKPMRAAARILRENAPEYGTLMAQEMGKPYDQGRAEAEKCAWVCEYYAGHAATFLQQEAIETDASKSFVTFQPLGVVLAVMPWNFPFWQVFRFAAPALMAGNAAVLKHASNVPGCAEAIEGIFKEAGFPQALFRWLRVASDQVERIIDHPAVRGVTLTGSTPAGRQVAQQASKALKKTVLELGGSDPYVVLEDADVESAVTTCVDSRLINSGQSCIAAKRFIVVDGIREAFEQRFVEQMSQKRIGDPMDEGTDVGPLARHDLRDELHRQVEGSIKRGADCVLGGEIPKGPGAFYPPTVLTDVTEGIPAYQEELFGPVAGIIPVRDEKEAIRRANDSAFGLGAAIFTQDTARGEAIAAHDLEAGSCFVNALVKSDPRLPFGGVKESGYGRELAHYGIKEFVNIKSVYIK